MRYVEPVFRPPSEARSWLLAVTTGCSHNRCSFCAMYRTKRFRVRPESEVMEDIARAKRTLGDVQRVFLLDGDAFVLSAAKLLRVLAALREAFPGLGRVGTYVNAGNVASKSDEELRALAAAGLRIGYLGLESGDPDLVARIVKGATVDEMVSAVRRAQDAGMRMSVMALLGLAGREGSLAHARGTAEALNRMQPRFVSFLTVTPVAGTPLGEDTEAGRFRARHGLAGPYLLYIGRIDENKGCPQLFDFFLRFKAQTGSALKLVLIGNSVLKIPAHPDVVPLGFLPEEDKFDALSGAEALVMPSFYESLSMVTLEAWALGRPVLANARCDVLRGQCRRSNGGLYYADYGEFRESLLLLLGSERLRAALGANGKAYYEANYTWDIIESKYRSILAGLGTPS